MSTHVSGPAGQVELEPTLTGLPEGKETKAANDTEFSRATRSFSFWMIIAACFTADFIAAFDLSVVSTALPTIVQDLGGNDFKWIGSAFALAGSAIVPLCGGLVSIWGRKPILLILLNSRGLLKDDEHFDHRSSACELTEPWPAFQEFGSCGALTVTEIIYADFVPLAQRGILQGMASLVWTVAGHCISKTSPHGLARKLHCRWWFCIVPFGSFVVGIVALLGFLVFERYGATEPLVPWSVFGTVTAVMGHIGTAVHGLVIPTHSTRQDYLPVYMQAVKLASPVRSGVYFLGYCMLITPAAMISGVSFIALNRYLPPWASLYIGGSILQNLLTSKLPASYIASLPSGISFAYSAIPTLGTLPTALQLQVRQAFADSLKMLWLALVGISCIGLSSVLFMKEIPMHTVVDEQWALDEKESESFFFFLFGGDRSEATACVPERNHQSC
ncbi:hypothetical protein BC835DRAFT_1531376 [Cytidiella melzeri]|nr:hypothetical protein BC835DRAFT_1531376 [Cytidiella melzeri]